MSTERRHRGGVAPGPEEQSPMEIALREALFKCCDEMGVYGCKICPVKTECDFLWADVDKINVTDYRRLDRQFTQLREKRGRILAKRGQGIVKVLT